MATDDFTGFCASFAFDQLLTEPLPPTLPWLILPRWSGERIDYSVRGSFCALGNAVPDILGPLRSVLCHVGCPSGGSRLNNANRDDNGENDRKHCFHGRKVSLPPARVRLPIPLRRAITTKIVRPRETTASGRFGVNRRPIVWSPTLLRQSFRPKKILEKTPALSL